MIESVEKQWVWVPNISLNDLFFDEEYLNYDEFIKDKAQADYGEYPEEISCKSEDDGSFFIFSNEKKIFERAEIFSNLYLNGENLINKTIVEVKKISGVDDFILDPEGDYYSSEKLDAIFWMINGKVESVSV